MPGVKTNERPGTRAVLRHSRMSAYKAREVLDLIRGKDLATAVEILEYSERGASDVIEKLLRSCAANAEHNDGMASDELFVSACYADEGTTLKRWRPRARGRATRIRKRTCHITVILSRLPEDEIARRRAKVAAEQAERRARRVAGTRRSQRRRAGAEPEGPPAWDELDTTGSAPSDALAALEEAREIESETHHHELESGAESALDFGDEDADEDDFGDEDADEDAESVGDEDAESVGDEHTVEPASPGSAAEAVSSDDAETEPDAGEDESGADAESDEEN
jgi:large subunit ribosomal protein L22